MANLYLKTYRQGPKIIKTYRGADPSHLLEETTKYYDVLESSRLKLPRTAIYLKGNLLVIEQDFVEGVGLNDFLKKRQPHRLGVVKNLLTGVVGSIGKVSVRGAHWVSDNRFALDASFSNFIVSTAAELYYVDLFPPRDLEAFLSGASRWGELMVSIPPERGEEEMRFKIYDARGIIFDILSHLVFYMGREDVGRLRTLIEELSLNNNLVERVLIDIHRKEKFYVDLFLGYLKNKGVERAQMSEFKRALVGVTTG